MRQVWNKQMALVFELTTQQNFHFVKLKNTSSMIFCMPLIYERDLQHVHETARPTDEIEVEVDHCAVAGCFSGVTGVVLCCAGG